MNNTEGKTLLSRKFKVVIILFVMFFLINSFIFRRVSVDGSSMYPNLKDGYFGLSNNIAIKVNSINRFDVVVVKNKQNNNKIIKRVIGLPGETISYINDKLLVDGTEIKEDFLDSSFKKKYLKDHPLFTNDFGPITLTKDEYFLLGDNRPNSIDSRVIGPFKKSAILSKDIIVLYPFDKMKIE